MVKAHCFFGSRPSLSQQHLLMCGDRDREASSHSGAMAKGDTEDYMCIPILIWWIRGRSPPGPDWTWNWPMINVVCASEEEEKEPLPPSMEYSWPQKCGLFHQEVLAQWMMLMWSCPWMGCKLSTWVDWAILLNMEQSHQGSVSEHL